MTNSTNNASQNLQADDAVTETAASAPAVTICESISSQEGQLKEPSRGLGHYAVDKTFSALGKGVNRMEEQKPGTLRKIAGIGATGLGITGTAVGIYLLVT